MLLKGVLGHFWYENIQNIAIFRPEKSLLSIQTSCHLVLYLFGDPHVSLLPSFPKTGKKNPSWGPD